MAAGEVIEEIAENLEEAADLTRSIDAGKIVYFLSGVGVGAAIGFFFGYRFNREKIRAEAFAQSEAEVNMIREAYRARMVAAEPKPAIEDLIEERGYSIGAAESIETAHRHLPPPVPITEPLIVTEELPEKVTYNESIIATTQYGPWNYPRELAARSPDHPYVIHHDEFKENEMDYSQTTYTYYAADDVLTDSDDTPLPHADLVVGLDNLKFGHGTEDVNLVYVRNDKLQLEMEICRSPKSFEEEVLGLQHSEHYEKIRRHRNRSEEDEEN